MNFKDLADSFFWLQQPSLELSSWDNLFGIIAAVLTALGLGLWGGRRFARNPVNKKLLGKFSNLSFTVGLFGLFWFGLRYENTPIFAKHIWFGLVVLAGLVWLAYLIKYLVKDYRLEKAEHLSLQLREKYLPKKR